VLLPVEKQDGLSLELILPCLQALFGGRLSERELVPFLETVSRVKEEVGVDFDVLQI
jgi:hypothetical protein